MRSTDEGSSVKKNEVPEADTRGVVSSEIQVSQDWRYRNLWVRLVRRNCDLPEVARQMIDRDMRLDQMYKIWFTPPDVNHQ